MQIGDRVRDMVGMGGVVLDLRQGFWFLALVEWNNGYRTWDRVARLTVETPKEGHSQ